MRLWEQLESAEPPPGWAATAARHALRVALAFLLAALAYLLFPGSPVLDVPRLDVGTVAPENVIAPFAFGVRKPPAELERERDVAARSAEPVLAFAPRALDSAHAELGALAAALDSAAPGGQAAILRAAAAHRLRLSPAEAATLAAPTRRAALVSNSARLLDSTLGGGVAAAGALDSARGGVILVRGADGEARSVPAESVPSAVEGNLGPGAASAPLPARVVGAVFHATLVADAPATDRRRTDLRRAVPENRFDVRAGEKIVGAHEVLNREGFEKLRALRDALQQRRRAGRRFGHAAGLIMLDLLLLLVFGAWVLLFRPGVYASMRTLGVVAGSFALVLVGAAAVARGATPHPELVPVALAGILLGVLLDARVGLMAVMTLAVLISAQGAFRGTTVLYSAMIGGATAALMSRAIRRRTDALQPIVATAAAYALASMAIGLSLGRSAAQIGTMAGLGALNALVSVALASILLPVAEEVTGIDTYPKLLEWSDLNRPLIRRLSLEAPGTYHHTIAMANLVEAACNAVGANGLLARVGVYYHDIGKLRKPQYFAENQPRGRNPHDRLKPATSAAIIRNHVREGLELAEQHGVPHAVRAFITEHHGTGQISYFLDKARERDGAAASPDYSYPGPLPRSAETAICMLADGVEAAARVLTDPTPERLREVVEHIVRQRMEQGQLRDAPLTLQQLETVKAQFVRLLVGQYHHRVDYPAASGGVTSEFASV